MNRFAPLILLLATTALAAEPATRPVVLAPTTPAVSRELPMTVNPTKPAFVPKFARAGYPPAGHFAERDYAYRFGQPGPFRYGYGYGGYGYGGYGFGGYGYGWRP